MSESSDVGSDYGPDEKVVEFFVMPSRALKTLRKELDRLIDTEASATVLFRHGYISGYDLGNKLGVRMELERIEAELPNIWAEVGLGRIAGVRREAERITVIVRESPEVRASKAVPYCDFTRGYLTGLVSVLTSRRHMGKEYECASQNGDRCVFVLSPVGGDHNET